MAIILLQHILKDILHYFEDAAVNLEEASDLVTRILDYLINLLGDKDTLLTDTINATLKQASNHEIMDVAL